MDGDGDGNSNAQGMYEHLRSLVNDQGLNKNIYSYFWSPSSRYGKLSCVQIPLTIVFEHNIPSEWYFYSQKDSDIKKKIRFNTDDIIKRFRRMKKRGEVIAIFYHKEPKGSDKPVITMELFTMEELGKITLAFIFILFGGL